MGWEDPPSTFDFALTLALDRADQSVTDNPGSLQRVSPEEPTHALLFSIQDAIQAGHGDDILKRWRALLLSPDRVLVVLAPATHATGGPST